jgi:ribosomal protein S18 acetylase RimI-like enzyme
MQASPLTNPNSAYYPSLTQDSGTIELLENSTCDEVLTFLKRRPIHTAYLAGMLRDNGLQSTLNRGTFYGCRNDLGQLDGVALIGHATLIEATSDTALHAFAKTAQRCRAGHLIMGEEDQIDRFWYYYAGAGQEMRRACRELLLELRWPIQVSQSVQQIRPATTADLDLLIPVHAEMAQEESGVDPREQDAAGFVERYARRISQGRTWILTDKRKLLFKAEVVAETPEATSIEGVWVNPETRDQGYGRRCMSQLARLLLCRTKSICLFVNEENDDARRFYRRAGFHFRAVYDTMFLK